MGSETATDPSGPTVGEILTCALIGAALYSASWFSIPFTMAFGLSAVAVAILSVSHSMRLAKRHNE